MAQLLNLTGEIATVGNLHPEDLPKPGTPGAVIRLDGQPQRFVVLTGLTEAECRALAPAFMEQVTLKVNGG